MRFGLMVAVLSAATLPADAATKKPAVQKPVAGNIELFQSEGRVLVMTRIGNGELTPMVFDTGSDGHTIDRSLARRLKLRRIGTVQEVDGTSGTVRMLPQVVLNDVQLGGLKVGTITAASVDYDRNDAMGIISSEMFDGSLVYLELARNRARIVPRNTTPPPKGTPIAYVEQIPTIQIGMPDGSTLPAHFDTGHNASLSLPVTLKDTLPLRAPAKVIGRFKSISAEGDVYGGQLKGTMTIGPLTLKDPQVSFLGNLANIGLPIIRQLTIVFDPEADVGWVLPARPTTSE